ncbi:MAG: RNA polymerase sigma factor [Flavobacteriales bacterium]
MIKSKEAFLLKQLKDGNQKTFQSIYENNREKFIHFYRKYRLEEDEIIDTYQDAYLIFYQNIVSGKLKTLTSSISTYLFSIGKYLILDNLRKNNKEMNKDYNLSIVGEEDVAIENFDIVNNNLSHEQELLYKYFNTLGKKCQELLNLFYYHGFTIKEIMQTKNYNNENVVKSQKSRCLKTLKERIKEDAE